MQTQCPHCATVFPIESEQFLLANGQVRCGVCEREFDALERLRREPVQPAEPPRLDPEFAARQGDLFAVPAPAQNAEIDPLLPGFLRPKAASPADGQGRWWLAVLALALILGLQMVLAERDRLADSPRWRPAVLLLCQTLGCELPTWREPQRWTLLNRDVVPHPSIGDALLVTAAIRNDARWSQPLPVLELGMADIDGQSVALRRFRPNEYLQGYDGRALAPGQTATLRLELADPGKSALAFAFEFR